MIKKRISVEDIITFLDKKIITVKGAFEGCFIDNIPDALHVTETSLDWVNSSKANKQEIVENSLARVLVVDNSIEYTSALANKGKVLLTVNEPRLTMAEIATHFFIEKKKPGIHYLQ